jgi:diguanylate cyclase (GGDEF)-like protein
VAILGASGCVRKQNYRHHAHGGGNSRGSDFSCETERKPLHFGHFVLLDQPCKIRTCYVFHTYRSHRNFAGFCSGVEMELGNTISILVLGFLVLVFGSILRRRATDQLQFWFVGWVLCLVHLLTGQFGPRIGVTDQITSSLSSSATILAGVSFIVAVLAACGNSRQRLYLSAAAAVPALVYTSAVSWNVTAKPILFAIVAGGLAAILHVVWSLHHRINRDILYAAAGCVALASLVSSSIGRGEFAGGIYAIQAGLFIFSGVLFYRRFPRWSIGPITTTIGFLAWGGSLLGIGSGKYGLSNAFMFGSAWNAPAYVVALGMILTVLEEQIQEAADAGRRLAYQAHHDALTGLPNRVLLEDRLSQALARARRTRTRAAVLCIDLDRFKQVNDTFGHHVGDLFLQSVVARLSSRIRESDTLARTGGDEFTVVSADFEASTIPARIAESLLETLQEPIMIQGCPLPATACIGMAVFPDDAKDADGLVRAADLAMYRAKGRGRNLYECFSAEARDSLDIQKHLRKAIDEGSFEIVYQPQFFKDGELACVEALLRFRHPTLGKIPPSRFIPIAEESGLIVPIGEWVLRQVCCQSVEWRKHSDAALKVAINVSALQFNRIDFADSVARILSETGADPAFVELELTEGLVMNNVEDSSRQMKSLKLLGVQIAVDDFGTGYSSLSYLHRLPIDTLKIDRSFVEKIADPGGTRPIVETIMSLARSLGMRTVAEGVETQAQLEIIRELDCDFIQGFLFCHPVSGPEVLALLSTSHGSGSVCKSSK